MHTLHIYGSFGKAFYVLCADVQLCSPHTSWDFPGKNTRVGYQALLQGDLPSPGIEPVSLISPALASEFFTPSTTSSAFSL